MQPVSKDLKLQTGVTPVLPQGKSRPETNPDVTSYQGITGTRINTFLTLLYSSFPQNSFYSIKEDFIYSRQYNHCL